MHYGIEGRVAVVTGAAGGIGAALARAFADQGACLVLIDRNEAALGSLAAELQAGRTVPGKVSATGAMHGTGTGTAAPTRPPPAASSWLQCLGVDLNDSAALAQACADIRAQWGRVDILVNNAGVEYPTPLTDPRPDFMLNWNTLLSNNVGSMVGLTRALLPLMAPGSAVINQSSIWGHTAVADFSAYAASKHAIIGLTRSLAWELAPAGIRVNAVCPGWVRTDAALRSLDSMAKAAGKPAADLLDDILAQQALPTLLEPEDLAGAFLFLSSSAARAITGQSLVVSNGEVMH